MSDGWITLRHRQSVVMLPAAQITAISETHGASFRSVVVTCGGRDYDVEESAAEIRRLIFDAVQSNLPTATGRENAR